MIKPWKIIQELESDNSRLKKEAIIKREADADNIRFFESQKVFLIHNPSFQK